MLGRLANLTVSYKYKSSHWIPLKLFARLVLQTHVMGLGDAFASRQCFNGNFVFVAGCGHSGTTLVAAKLGNHENVYTIGRETGIFLPRHGLYTASIMLSEWEYAAACNSGAAIVLEKTPKHVHCVERIWKVVSDARIILIARNPLDTCASLYKRYGRLDMVIERWNMDNRALLKVAYKENVFVIKYEHLLDDPASGFDALCNFLGIDYAAKILAPGDTTYDKGKLTGNMALRRNQVRGDLVNRNGAWGTILNRAEVDKVLRRTRAVAEALGYAMR